jgi:general secretion pathway protein J
MVLQRRRRRRSAGFTLLEVMVSVGIVGFIGVLIYGAFHGMSRSRTNMNHMTDRYHQGRAATERMAREMSAAFISNHVSAQQLSGVQGSRQTGFIGNESRVDFTSFSHRRLGLNAHESDQNELSYFLSPGPNGGQDLVRREAKHIDDDPSHGGVVLVMADNVDSFELSYLDPTTNDWTNTWDSTQPAAQLGRLPTQVSVRLVLNNGPGGSRVTFQSKVSIPIVLPLSFAN